MSAICPQLAARLWVHAVFLFDRPFSVDELVKIIHIHNKYSVVLSAYIFLVCLRDIVILQ
jgi:hypothetical protein